MTTRSKSYWLQADGRTRSNTAGYVPKGPRGFCLVCKHDHLYAETCDCGHTFVGSTSPSGHYEGEAAA